MATGITGRLIRRTTKEPLQGITIEAVNASTGVSASTTTTTDTKGFFEISGLTSAVYFAKPLVSGDDWDLLPNIAEIYTDEIHIASNGSLTIDGAVTSGEVSAINIDLTSTSNNNTIGVDTSLSSSSGTGDRTAVYGSVLKSGTASMLSLLGGSFSAESTSTGGTITSMAAVGGIAAANGAGQTITSLVGVSGVVSGTAGTVTEGIGVAASASYGTTQIGVKITNPSSGANNYAIKSTATAQSEFAGSVKSSHATGGIGYATGAGGTVTQLTSKTTGVTLNNICGTVVTHNAALGSGASAVWLVTNSAVGANDVVILNFQDTAASTANAYTVEVAQIVAGGFNIRLTNTTGGSLSEAVTINFAVIKAVAA